MPRHSPTPPSRSAPPPSPSAIAGGYGTRSRRSRRCRAIPSRACCGSALCRLADLPRSMWAAPCPPPSHALATRSPRLLRRLLLLGRDDLLGLSAGQFLHMVEMMGEAADAEGQGAQLDDQIVQFAARQVGPDDVPAGPVLLGVIAADLSAAPANQPLHPCGE